MEENQVLTGEVIGYDTQSLTALVLEEIENAKKNFAISAKTAFILKNITIEWSNSLLSQGMTTVNLANNM